VQSITRLLVAAVLASASVRWQDSPEYLALFAPANQRQVYAIAVSTASLDDALAEAAADPMAAAVPGAWQPGGESAADAFGTAGPYNRWLLTQLYGSRQARVARGARMDRGKVIESWTLISPYPSPDLRTLHPGTMRLILKVE
jgi:hypothetical protein